MLVFSLRLGVVVNFQFLEGEPFNIHKNVDLIPTFYLKRLEISRTSLVLKTKNCEHSNIKIKKLQQNLNMSIFI